MTTTEGEKQVPSLSSVYTSETAVAVPTFRAPVPPGLKVEWFPAVEEVPHDPNSFFPVSREPGRLWTERRAAPPLLRLCDSELTSLMCAMLQMYNASSRVISQL